jgi:GNAT superfamily N-acetyltransferase
MTAPKGLARDAGKDVHMLEIVEVTTVPGLKKFVDFQYGLYSGNPFFIPPLRSDEMNTLRWDKNPAFDFCEAKYWLACRGNKVVGRVAGIINRRYNQIWGRKTAKFGWIDFIDDGEVARALLETVEAWAKSKGMELVCGPLSFCGMDREGTLVEGFEELGTISTLYNFPYYKDHFEKLGYGKDTDWVEYSLKVPREIPEKVDRLGEVVMKRSKLRLVEAKTAKELLPYGKELFDLLNEAYKDLEGAVPLTDKQVDMYVKQYFTYINAEYVKIILDEKNKIAAFGIGMPSLSKAFQKARGRLFPFGFVHILRAIKKNDSLDLYLVAVRPDLQNKGVNAVLMTEMNRSCIRNGIVRVESGGELEDNAKVQAFWKHYDARQHKRRRSFVKELR